MEKTNQHIANTNSNNVKAEILKFDIFKGIVGQDGKVTKIRSVGNATIASGSSTYHLRLKSLLTDTFFLLPETKKKDGGDYAILTREPSLNAGRKFFWHRVGEAKVLQGTNHGLMSLEWDLFPNAELYMNLYPVERSAADTEVSVVESDNSCRTKSA